MDLSMLSFHDNGLSLKAAIVTFLEDALPDPPCSPGLAPCDYFLFPRMKKMLPGKNIHVVRLWDQLISSV